MHARLALSLCTLALGACSDETPQAAQQDASGKPLIVTTFYPTQFLTERLGGDLVEVRNDLPQDADALDWMPSDEHVAAYQAADLIVLSGAGLELWLDKVSLPPSRLVDTSQPYADDLLQFETVTHSHGDSGEHSHEGVDPHTWLDPRLLIQQAGEIHAALKKLLPEHGPQLAEHWRALQGELEAIDQSFAALGPLPAGTKLYANHPAYNYMARRYGWTIESFDLDPQTMPSDHDLEHLAEDVDRGARGFLIWESAPLPAIAQRLEQELGLTSVVVSPAEMPPLGKGDLLDILRANHASLAVAFTE